MTLREAIAADAAAIVSPNDFGVVVNWKGDGSSPPREINGVKQPIVDDEEPGGVRQSSVFLRIRSLNDTVGVVDPKVGDKCDVDGFDCEVGEIVSSGFGYHKLVLLVGKEAA